jgi:hypothetical protein
MAKNSRQDFNKSATMGVACLAMSASTMAAMSQGRRTASSGTPGGGNFPEMLRRACCLRSDLSLGADCNLKVVEDQFIILRGIGIFVLR